jgi:hypothetical protein
VTAPTQLIPPNQWVRVPELPDHDIRVDTHGPVRLRLRPHRPQAGTTVPPLPAAPCGLRRQPRMWA